jgi:hypothetical protein
MMNFSDRIIQALNEQGRLQAATGYEIYSRLSILLNWQPKLVFGGKGETAATGSDSASAIPYTSHAMGGVIPAYGLGLVSEHLNPTFLRAGAEPIIVSPFSPQPSFNDNNFRPPVSSPNSVPFRGGGGNSNAELVAEVKALRKELEQMRKENNSANLAIANGVPRAIANQTEELGEKIEQGGKRVEYGLRQASRDQRVRG